MQTSLKKILTAALVVLMLPGMASAAQMVTLVTTEGEIKLALDSQRAPQTVANFLNYARSGAYNGTIFHRVIPEFMIQGGGFDANLNRTTTGPAIENESNNGLSNVKGSVAMARTNAPHSATNQFFINLIDNNFLDYGAQGQSSWGYTVFGQVVEGMEIVESIQHVATTRLGGHQNVPREPIIIEQVKISISTE